MDGWNEFGEESDFSDTTESLDRFDESCCDVDESISVSSIMDAVEPIENDIEFLEDIDETSNIDHIDSVMDSAETTPIEFDKIDYQEGENLEDPALDDTEGINVQNQILEIPEDTAQNQILDIPVQESPEEQIDELMADNLDYSNAENNMDDVKVLKRDETELWQEGNNAIEDTLEALRDDLRDKGLEDGSEMEAFVMQEKTLLQQELSQNTQGDFSNSYDKPSWQESDISQELTDVQENIEDVNDNDVSDGYENDALSVMNKTEIPEIEFDGETQINDMKQEVPEEVYEAKPNSEIEIIQEDGTVDTIENIQDSIEHSDEIEQTDDVQDSIGETNEEIAEEISEVRPIDEVGDWLEEINPNFDPFDIDSPYCNNCGSCTYAVYQRLEGNKDICATAENIGYNSEMEALTGMEQVSMSPEEIETRLLEAGDGAHAIIGIDRSVGPGHWFNAANIGGKVVAIDGQSGEINDWPPDYGNVVNWEMSVKKEI